MNKVRSLYSQAVSALMQDEQRRFSRAVRIVSITSLVVAVSVSQSTPPHAQQQRFKEPAVKVTGVASGKNLVTISADGPLTRAQTFQTPGEFHVVLVNGQTDLGAGAPRGVRVQRIGNSLELIVPIRAGANVTVQPRGNRLDLVMAGDEGAAEARREENSRANTPAAETEPAGGEAPSKTSESALLNTERRRKGQGATPDGQVPPGKRDATVPGLPVAAGAQPNNAPQSAMPATPAAGAGGDVPPPAPDAASAGEQADASYSTEAADAAAQLNTHGEAGSGTVFSLMNLLLVAGAVLLGVLFYVVNRRRAGAKESDDEEVAAKPDLSWLKKDAKERQEQRELREENGAGASAGAEDVEDESQPHFEQNKGDRRKLNIPVLFDRRRKGRGAEDEASRQMLSEKKLNSEKGEQKGRRSDARLLSPSTPSIIFGAYRIEQEVSRLVRGMAHSIEVLSSRAPDDRRALEASLLKALRSPETDEDGQRRARMALEDYGFVARQNATLLLSSEAYERMSAARTLGEMRSSQALPFLTEALYDQESVVRTEVVQSLGALGLPSAIGALLDVARRHPEIPASVLGPALTACSVESLEVSLSSIFENRTFGQFGTDEHFTGEITNLDPSQVVVQLPVTSEDETFTDALQRLQSADTEARISAAQTLAQFQVQRAVDTLGAMTVRDEAAAVRAAAVTSLSAIDHESVFAPVLMAMADDSREVRAAAARALSRLSFDRADAYVRVIETSDMVMLREVAQACVKSGLASQAINRLASEDRRQAYEAFSLLSLVVKAGETQPIIDAVEAHRDIEVRLAAIRLLGLMYQPELIDQLRDIAGNGGVPEKVRVAILDSVSRSDRTAHAETDAQ